MKGPMLEPDETGFSIDNMTKSSPCKKMEKRGDGGRVRQGPEGFSSSQRAIKNSSVFRFSGGEGKAKMLFKAFKSLLGTELAPKAPEGCKNTSSSYPEINIWCRWLAEYKKGRTSPLRAEIIQGSSGLPRGTPVFEHSKKFGASLTLYSKQPFCATFNVSGPSKPFFVSQSK
ncbi:hypothetical protein Q8A67_024112 [Cirrhinus molitorella]|uniref:Uncharacterized protein n=1 Tax=Cirrhinus molitorella TaxID=172907 RepID=A0AA88TJW0_9TELE|nr:hypothetical protein Q8A67_024112 [Cirrhinus molitorella]